MQNSTITITFIFYILAMLFAGLWAFKQTSTISDYFLGGRKLGSFVTALSAGASDMSGWLLLGLPGYAYLAGLEAIWIALGLFIGTWLNWLILAPKLRQNDAATGSSITLADYFEKRFNDDKKILRSVSGLFILVFFLFYTSSGLVAGGKLFNTVFGLPYVWAVVLGGATIILYTFLGGFLAVCWTDVIQGSLMFLALTLVPILAIVNLGGFTTAFHDINTFNIHLLNPLINTSGETLSFIAILSLMGWGLGYFGQPHILARFMAIESPDKIPNARRIGVSWAGFSMLGALFVGLAGIGFVNPPLLGPDSETVFIELVQALLHPIPAGICLAAILAAIMSTADSQLLVSSSALAKDIYQPFIHPHASPKELMWVGRAAVILIAVLAFLLALDPNNKVLDLVAYAWAGFGATFGPVLIISLYWKNMTKYDALAGMLTGAVTVIWWKQLGGGIFDLYEIVPGFLFSIMAIFITQIITNRISK